MKFTLRCAVAVAASLLIAPAWAQSPRTYVSGIGDDANPCSRTAPCKTFAGAMGKTSLNGEINCLDPAGYGIVTITKSITIDCHDMSGAILNTGTYGINIRFDQFAAVGEQRKTVRLRNLTINGVDTGTVGIVIIGGANSADTEVIVEDCVIDGNWGGVSRGISDERTGGGQLFVTNTTVRNMAGNGIAIVPGGGLLKANIVNTNIANVGTGNQLAGILVRPINGGRANVAVSRTTANGGSNGIFVDGSGGAGPGNLTVTESVFSNNTVNGIAVYSPSASFLATIHNSTMTMNAGAGATVAGGASTIRIGGSVITSNVAGVANSGGTLQSFGNNIIMGNGTDGAPAAVPLR